MNKNDPIFKHVFGDKWNILPKVIQKHYANRPYRNDIMIFSGLMDVKFGIFIKLISPLLWLFKVLVPYQGNNIPTIVEYHSNEKDASFKIIRKLEFQNIGNFIFSSSMMVSENKEVIELMRFGIGWKIRYSYEQEKVILNHQKYVWKIFGIIIPIPLEIFIGKGYAEEEALSEDSFKMKMHLEHKLFGKIYEYRGIFNIDKESLCGKY